MSKLIELTKKLWKEYLSGNEESILELLGMFQENSSVIGTGKHEFYKNLHDFRNAISEELQERKNIKLQFQKLKCEEMKLDDDISLIYGSVEIRWENDEKTTKIAMDSRFSILYKKENGIWKILHIHQSTPNNEQMYGGYYPKTLVDQVETANEKIKSLTKLAEIDSLTGLINIRTLKEKYKTFPNQNTWMFVIDIDNFKKINDKYGHLTGDYVLIMLSQILSTTIRENDLVCRMGGDEFILLCTDIKTEKDAKRLAERLLTNVYTKSKIHTPLFSISIGLTRLREKELFENVFKRADHALYNSKRRGKGKASIEY